MIQDNDEIKKNDNSENNNTHKNAEADEKQQVKIEFPYSDIVRSQMPKVFETTEKVATEVAHHWKNEGDFSNLGLPHPIADLVATQALQKAKKIEKKLDEKGVISLAKMGFEIAKAQLENLKKKI
ncbi:MAG: hypothetical protein WA160_08715 [Pseudobdellovibrio sp.]